MNFYRQLAPFYDDMTEFGTRIDREKMLLKELVESHSIQSALDMGCGTGTHTIALAELGVNSRGIDISGEMIAKARANADKRNADIHLSVLDFENWHRHIRENFDGVFCLANSLPHILHRRKLVSVISNVYKRLNKSGIFVIQIVNYNRILKNRDRILSVKKTGKHTFIRFYDFLPKLVNFNILHLTEENGAVTHSLLTTQLNPLRSADLFQLLKECGFGKVRGYSDLRKNRFAKMTSKDIVIIAER